MNLNNYTSVVPAITSMGRIEKALIESGATAISKTYNSNPICIAIRFSILLNNIPIIFELPALVNFCFKVLWAEIKKPVSGTRERIITWPYKFSLLFATAKW